ncbi:MAG: glutamine amidotransferase [Eudoraea sp.]|uniref:glutamine amidotransferase n=1 Tax=Eudoraea sp. TaxID=1979955 RepID=UPI003C75D4AB
MKKFLILQMRPETEASDSEFEAILRYGGLSSEEVHRIRVEQENIEDIDINNYSAIIAGGSPFDISIPEAKKSATQKRVEVFFNSLFDKLIPLDFPFLGACSGNGLLGRYCGATITNKYAEPLRSVEVWVTDEGAKDPVLKGLPKKFSALVGHKEACDAVPPGAVLLVSSDPCPVQMFRVKKNIYATQFHPEADADEFILRIKIYKYAGYFKPEEAEDLISAIRQSNTPVPKKILSRFIDRYRSTK